MKNFEYWRFGVQVFFSTIVISLCIFKLSSSDVKNDPNTAMYWGGLTGVLGYWLPSPNSDDKEKQKKQFDSVAANLNNGYPNQPNGQIAITHSSETTQQ